MSYLFCFHLWKVDFQIVSGSFRHCEACSQTFAGIVSWDLFPALEAQSYSFPTLEDGFLNILIDCDQHSVSSFGKSLSRFKYRVGRGTNFHLDANSGAIVISGV